MVLCVSLDVTLLVYAWVISQNIRLTVVSHLFVFKLNPEYHNLKREIAICLTVFIEYRIGIRYSCSILSETRSVYIIFKDISDGDLPKLERLCAYSIGQGIIDKTFDRMVFSVGHTVDLDYPLKTESVKDRNYVLVYSWFSQILEIGGSSPFYTDIAFTDAIDRMGLKGLFG